MTIPIDLRSERAASYARRDGHTNGNGAPHPAPEMDPLRIARMLVDHESANGPDDYPGILEQLRPDVFGNEYLRRDVLHKAGSIYGGRRGGRTRSRQMQAARARGATRPAEYLKTTEVEPAPKPRLTPAPAGDEDVIEYRSQRGHFRAEPTPTGWAFVLEVFEAPRSIAVQQAGQAWGLLYPEAEPR